MIRDQAVSLLRRAPLPGVGHDELRSGDNLRPSWQVLGDELTRLGTAGMATRAGEAERLLRENALTWNATASATVRPWLPDLIPWVIDGVAWQELVAGVAQRARLIEALLADAYGPQRLLGNGIHPATILGHPGYLRPLHGVSVPRRLVTYGCDVLRTSSGWAVSADRTQAPVGIGYALETRIASSRTLPEAYRSCQVQRLAPFSIARRSHLAALAPRHRDNPRIVLLTPGTGSAVYGEHAWLARYLGYTLVEGADLTVRDESVFLKTLGGLLPVDVILRSLDDAWCDSLELRDDSLLGIPGLVTAVRAGTVTVANALGSGIGDGGLWLDDALCQRVLGEVPLLSAVPTWWGGDPRSDLANRIDQLLLRQAFVPRAKPIVGWELNRADRSELADRIRAAPHVWLGQDPPPAAAVPVWTSNGVATHHAALRVFATIDIDGAITVMPGGLVGVHRDARAVVAMDGDHSSKDCWVLADGPVPEVSLLTPVGAPLVLQRGGVDLPSRVADNFYWIGRYAERAEDLCRLLRPCLGRLGEQPTSLVGGELAALVEVMRRLGIGSETSIEARIRTLACNPACPNGLHAIIAQLQTCAAAVRDRLSNDTWRALHHLAMGVPSDDGIAGLSTALDRLVLSGAALAGMAAESTTRGPGWRFLDLGRRLERAAFTLDLLRSTVAQPDGDRVLEIVLEVADASITYRGRYLTSLQAGAVVDLLLTDPTNPRSVLHLAEAVESHVRQLPRAGEPALPSPCERLALGAATWLKLLDPHELCRRDENGARSQLIHVIDHLSSDLGLLSDAISSAYLTHASAGRTLMPGWAART